MKQNINLTDEQILRLLGSDKSQILSINKKHLDYLKEFGAAFLLSRLIHHSDGGWLVRSAEQLSGEICFSARTVMRAKKRLEALGLISTRVKKRNGIPTLHWLVNYKEVLNIELRDGGKE